MAGYRSTKLKITVGYILLLAFLFFSLIFVYHEMENLSASDNRENLRTDSLMVLLEQKDRNTLQMLRILSEANDSLLSASEVEKIITEQDSVFTHQRVQHRVIAKRDSLLTPRKKKGFFKRLAEAFSPSKKDSAVLLKTSLEMATDTILKPSASADSLQQKIRTASEEKRLKRQRRVRHTKYQAMNAQLTARVDSLILSFEEELTARAREEAMQQQELRLRSVRTIGGIATGAVLLSALFLILILRDITRKNQYRIQLEEANKRAEDLLSAREKLMLAITHDFKAPLGSIMGYTDLLSGLTGDERQRFYLNNMKSSSEHLLKLVNDLLDFHRLDLNKAEIHRTVFLPDRLFEEICTRFEPIVTAKGLRFKYSIAPVLSASYVSDPLRIHQIVNNLLSNAVKFTPAGEISLTVNYELPKLIISVADTGKGMNPDDYDRIFREFTRLPGAQGEEGFGLGLSIVHKLVTLLHGTIDVKSLLGKGSCFTVTLPLFPSSEKPSSLSPDMHRDLPGKQELAEDERMLSAASGLHILLIDDDKIQLDLTAAMLGRYSITTVCCEQIEELVDRLRSSKFDALLTDIQMPAMNGFDLVKLLRASNIGQARTIPVIAVTARSEIDESLLTEHGFAGCLHKPFSIKELLQLLSGIGLIADNKHNAPSDYDFAALTAFSGDDPVAAHALIRTFIEETEKNAQSLRQASIAKDVAQIAALAHKMLPLFTLIGAVGIQPALQWLESNRESSFTDEMQQKVTCVLQQVALVLDHAARVVSAE